MLASAWDRQFRSPAERQTSSPQRVSIHQVQVSLRLSKMLPKQFPSARQPRLHCALAERQYPRYLHDVDLLDILEHQRLAIFGRKSHQRAIEVAMRSRIMPRLRFENRRGSDQPRASRVGPDKGQHLAMRNRAGESEQRTVAAKERKRFRERDEG